MSGKSLVPLGTLGNYYVVRHALGQYRSDAVTATYSFRHIKSAAADPLSTLLDEALRGVLKRHPVLSFGIAESTPEDSATFVRLDAIRRSDICEVFERQASSEISLDRSDTSDQVLDSILANAHNETWCRAGSKPVWKIIVLTAPPETEVADMSRSADLDKRMNIDVIFIAHHAIADGLSGVAFHKCFVEGLRRAVESAPLISAWPYVVPEGISIPTPLEELVDFSFTPKQSETEEQRFKIWAGRDPADVSWREFRSRVRTVSIPSQDMLHTLGICKSLGITLTGYLHGVIQLLLAQSVKEAHKFRYVTPFSVRNKTKYSAEEIVNHISFLVSTTEDGLVDELRGLDPKSKDALEAVVKVARNFSSEMASSTAAFPQGSPWLDLNAIDDMDEYCKAQGSKERSLTYELSNLGVSVMSSRDEDVVQVRKMVFTQCGMVVGPAFACNLITTKGGFLVFSLTWQEGVVEQNLIDFLADSIQSMLCSPYCISTEL